MLALGAGALAAAPARASGKKGEVGIGVILGGGRYKNDDFNRDLEAHGYGAIDSGVEYGFGVDYRLSRWVSVGFEALRVGGSASQPTTGALDSLGQYSTTASPLAFDLVGHMVRSNHGNFDLFVGAGPLLAATVSVVSDPFELSASKAGIYAHAGFGAELRLSPMVAIGARALVRHARANRVDLRNESGDPNAIWDLDFSGVAFSIGPRIYLGNVE